MSRKIYTAVLPLLAVVAFAAAPATSQAAFHWYKCEKAAGGTFNNNACTASGATNEFSLVRLPFTEAKLQVVTFGKLKLTLASGAAVSCKVSDAGNVWNTLLAEPGKDEVVLFVNYECVSEPAAACPEPEIVAEGLPWKTELTAAGADKITGAKVALFCSKAKQGSFEEEAGKLLEPTLTNPTTSEPLVATFSATTGELTSALLGKAKVEGKDRLVGFEHGENIFVKNP